MLAGAECPEVSRMLAQRLPREKAEDEAALREWLGEPFPPHLTCPPGPEPPSFSTLLTLLLLESCSGHGLLGKSRVRS